MTHDADSDAFGELAEEFTAAVRRGEAPSVEVWAGRHPQHADEIRELFPTILAMEELKDGVTREAPPRLALGPNERLGDFRIVREIGRGGMGVVYEAVQESLGRRVAVKVLPSLGDVRRVRRFEREARTAARLHHSNIVPIFGVGSVGEWQYYVMQVIRGVGLDAVIGWLRNESEGGSLPESVRRGGLSDWSIQSAVRSLRTGVFRPVSSPTSTIGTVADESGDDDPADRPTAEAVGLTTAHHGHALPPDPGPPLEPRARYWRSVASLGRQVAAALGYAHAQGVLHRDVKPANLLLDEHGVVWVTDFGLATAIEAEGLTRSGDLLGTLQYMAPEQLKGVYDERTDLYGLGLTLYELLTLRPAFHEADRGRLLERVSKGVDQRPSRLRPGIPGDLETIVLKAVSADPRHRYRTAGELADDLQRFLEDRPIHARRATAMEHGWRWCRRNKALASAAALAGLSLVVAGVVGWVGYVSTREALAREGEAARAARDNLKLAVEVLEGIREKIAGPPRLELVGTSSDDESQASYAWETSATSVTERDADLLEQLLDFHERIAEQHAGDPALRLDAANAWRRVADVQLRLGRGEEAVEHYRRALELFEDDIDPVTAAAIRNDLAAALVEAGERQEAEQGLAALVASLADEASEAGRYERARAHELLGTLRSAEREMAGRRGGRGGPGGRGRPGLGGPPPGLLDPELSPPPFEAFDRPPRDGFGGPPPGEDRGQRHPGEGGRRRGQRPFVEDFLREHGRPGNADFEAAWNGFRELTEEHPDNPEYRLAAARSGREYARTLIVFSDPHAQPAVLERVQDLTGQCVMWLEDLVARFPDVPDYRAELVEARLVVPPPERGERSGNSWESLRRAKTQAEQLVEQHPAEIRYRRALARVLAQEAFFELEAAGPRPGIGEFGRPGLDADVAARVAELYGRAIQQLEGGESPADQHMRIQLRLEQLQVLRRSNQFAEVPRLLQEIRSEPLPGLLERRLGPRLQSAYTWAIRQLRESGRTEEAERVEALRDSLRRER